MKILSTVCLVLGIAFYAGATSYLDLMEMAVGAYDDARIEEYTREAETKGVQEHGFPRLAANLAQLVAAGRMTERKDVLARMMTAACASAKQGKMPPKSGGNEFSVRELVQGVVALERAGCFPKETLAAWKADLAAVDANKCYTWAGTKRVGEKVGHNWPLFGAASEQARIHYGLGGDPRYIEAWVADQLRHFDENGMYRDPHEPAVYDFVGRMCYMAILHFGYNGPSRAKVEEQLEKSAEPTLAMLSACGEIPYGGRSNQFLHNHTMYAAVTEWYAAFFAKRGDEAKAARFREAARRAVAAMEPWLRVKPLHHVKNLYPPPQANGKRNVDQRWFGCEGYAYFDKYMITMASWAALAREFEGAIRNSELGIRNCEVASSRPGSSTPQPFSFSTSSHFHWKFVNSANYTVQEDWNANPQYDATGVGRIHRRGAPPAICLSAPFARKPNYFIGVKENPGPLAIVGWKEYSVTDEGVRFKCDAKLTLPAFEFDGAEETKVECTEQCVKIGYRGWTCRYTVTGGRFVDTGMKYFNRNGRYRRIDAEGDGPFEVAISIEPDIAPGRVCAPSHAANGAGLLEAIESPILFAGDEHTAYRDPAVYEKDGRFFLFFTVVKIEPDGAIYSYTAESESGDLARWTPPRLLTPRGQDLNYSSPGNVVKDGDEYVLCLQTYPRPGNTVANMPMYANATARLFTMRSKDLRTWSAPELIRVKGPEVPVEKIGRMIDPYLLRDRDDPGKWWCFFKQKGASRAHSRDLRTWVYDGRVEAGENVCVLLKDGEYVMFHSPKNGIAVKRSRDLVNWRDDPGLITLGQSGWNWAKGRLTAGAVIDARHVRGVGRYLMFFHGSGPRTEPEGDFDRNASIGLAWSDDLVNWSWPGRK